MAETWIFNNSITLTSSFQEYISFTSNGQQFSSIKVQVSGPMKTMSYTTESSLVGVYTGSAWTMQDYRTVTFETAPTGDLLTWLQTNAVKQAPKISIDLTTLSGWEDLEYGEHSITVKAKADGYRDSEASESVSVTKAASGFEVTIAAVQDPPYNNCRVYDGNSSSGIDLDVLGAETKTYQITSGFVYLEADNQIQTTPTTTGGVSTVSTSDNSALFSVTGNGTIGNVGFWCFVEGTLITLADGSKKPVEDITYEDELLVWNFYEGKLDTAKPLWIMPEKQAYEYNKLTFANGAELKLVGSGGDIGYHRIYNDSAKMFTHTGVPETRNGCLTFTEDEEYTELLSQEIVREDVKYYNIITDKHYNLFASGILTSCRLSNQYQIEDMKYVGESLLTEKEISDYLEKLER